MLFDENLVYLWSYLINLGMKAGDRLGEMGSVGGRRWGKYWLSFYISLRSGAGRCEGYIRGRDVMKFGRQDKDGYTDA